MKHPGLKNQANQKRVRIEMRINEYSSLDEFTSQYIGEWSPSEGHYYGLEFRYNFNDYRLHTWQMYANDPAFTADGREVLFGLYRIHQKANGKDRFTLMASFTAMEELLTYTGIDGRQFSEIIMDDSTQILGQD